MDRKPLKEVLIEEIIYYKNDINLLYLESMSEKELQIELENIILNRKRCSKCLKN